MSAVDSTTSRVLVFYCTRQKPSDHPGFRELVIGESDSVEIEVPCSGRVGTGEIMRGLAEGYDRVIVLSCGVKSCVHRFGCPEAKKAMEKARKLAQTAGLDPKRIFFYEADNPDGSGE